MRTLPVIFCLTCFFFPAIASAQLAPGWVSEVLNVGALPWARSSRAMAAGYASAWRAVLGNVGKRLDGFRRVLAIPITSTLRCSGSPPGGRDALISWRN